MDTNDRLNFDSIYAIDKTPIEDDPQWEITPRQRLDILETSLKALCKRDGINVDIIPNRRDKNRNILFLFEYGSVHWSYSIDGLILVSNTTRPEVMAVNIFKLFKEELNKHQ